MDRAKLHTCAGLEPGDVIQAHLRGILEFTGCVTETQIGQEHFWAVDGIGQRHLVDLASYEVFRLSPPYL